MKRHRFELILAVILLTVYIGFVSLQSANRLTKPEVDDAIATLEKNVPVEKEEFTEFLIRLRAWCESDDGQPVLMMNLMRFYDQIKPVKGGPTGGTPREANAYYEREVAPLMLKVGAYPLVISDPSGVLKSQKASNLLVHEPALDNWDRLVIARYPGRRSFLNLITDPEFQKLAPYKLAALKVVLMPVDANLHYGASPYFSFGDYLPDLPASIAE